MTARDAQVAALTARGRAGSGHACPSMALDLMKTVSALWETLSESAATADMQSTP